MITSPNPSIKVIRLMVMRTPRSCGLIGALFIYAEADSVGSAGSSSGYLGDWFSLP